MGVDWSDDIAKEMISTHINSMDSSGLDKISKRLDKISTTLDDIALKMVGNKSSSGIPILDSPIAQGRQGTVVGVTRNTQSSQSPLRLRPPLKKGVIASSTASATQSVTKLGPGILTTDEEQIFNDEKKRYSDKYSNFTNDYGAVNMISFLCAVWSRLAYMDDHDYLGHYSKIFGGTTDTREGVIPIQMLTDINANANIDSNLFNDTIMFGLNGTTNKYGLDTYDRSPNDNQSQFGEKGLKFSPFAQKINQINGEERYGDVPASASFFAKKPKISDNLKNRLTNCNVNLGNIEENPNVVMISIATSNYRNIYITGDKRMPNIVW